LKVNFGKKNNPSFYTNGNDIYKHAKRNPLLYTISLSKAMPSLTLMQ